MTNLNLQKRWNAYIERGGDLLDVPDEFRNQDLCNLFLDKRGIEKNEDLQARFIEYINAGGYLGNVPVEYRNQVFWIAYINAGGYLSDVPDEFKNEQIQDLFLKNKKC